MSSWALRAAKKRENEFVPGSSKFVAHELGYQFAEAGAQIGEHYREVKSELDWLSVFTANILDGKVDMSLDDETGGEMNTTVVEPAEVRQELRETKTTTQTREANERRQEKTSDGPLQHPEVNPVAAEAVEVIQEGTPETNLNPKTQIAEEKEEEQEQEEEQEEEQEQEQKKEEEEQEQEQEKENNSGRMSEHLHVEPTKVVEIYHDSTSPSFLLPKTPAKPSMDSDSSFQAISTAIRKSTAKRMRDEENFLPLHLSNRPRSSIFVPLPARSSILPSKKSGQESSFVFENQEPTGVKNSAIADDNDDDVSEKKPSSVAYLMNMQSSPENRSISKQENKRGSEEPRRPNSPRRLLQEESLRAPSIKLQPVNLEASPSAQSTPHQNRSPTRATNGTGDISAKRPVLDPESSSPEKVLARLTSPTISSAAKVRPKRVEPRKEKNRFLATLLQSSKTATSEKIGKDPKLVAPKSAEPAARLEHSTWTKSTKKSMMEKRSEAAALKKRQKIFVNLNPIRKSESAQQKPDDRGHAAQSLTPQTPMQITPENLPHISSDDDKNPSQKIIQPWGASPELQRLARARKSVDPATIFPANPVLDLSKVFNKAYDLQSPAPTPHK
ncbi:uncharacterized protein LODBEIA_P30730 [Lodderomyces beijingensis]|uniref:Inner centromere protein ARK-binding domain-containing protein n=1 Tax=Lodderomyces beijingensis TaxID=1775926 RepID=A0ABP0ZL28_9ASCO